MATVTESTLQPLEVGTSAPDFDLPASGNQHFKLSDFRGKNLIIVFYPKDQTPGCTKQLCALRDDIAMFRELNTEILGCNPGSMDSHDRFVAKENYPFPILVDADRSMAKAYNALKENGTSIQRTVYIIDKEGIIRFAKQGMPSDTTLANTIRGFSN
jgi:peroxiredoxin Q/BCP